MSLDPSYRICYEKKFEKWVKKNFPQKLKGVLDEKLRYFSENPNHPSLNTKPYTGVSRRVLKQLEIDAVFEFYVNMDYRIILYISHVDKTIIIAFIGTHDEVRRYIKNS